MQGLLNKLDIRVNENIYLKNPHSSDLGKNIIRHGVEMIDANGFEDFTFRKLGKEIGSPEASIYRYFESKHKLLLYLTSWYWAWMEYQLLFEIANIESAEERLRRALNLLTRFRENSAKDEFIDIDKLHRIVINESSKSYLIKEVDKVNKEGAYIAYKELVERVADLVLEINPDYKYPHMLISTVIEGAHHQRYFAQHLPRLTDREEGKDTIPQFYELLVFNTLNKKNNGQFT